MSTPGQEYGLPRRIGIGTVIATEIDTFFSGTVEVLWRHEFGERYFKGSALTAAGVILIVLLAFVWRITFGLFLGPASIISWLFIAAFMLAGMVHRYRIFRRNWYTGPEWHSFASGKSWIKPLTSGLKGRMGRVPVDDATQRYIEPSLTGLVGLVLLLTSIDPFLGIWLIIAGFALFNKEGLLANVLRNEYLDRVDGEIENSARVELLTQGWTEPGMVPANPQTSIALNGFRTSIPFATRTPKQREDAVTTLQALFPAEMEKARKLTGQLA